MTPNKKLRNLSRHFQRVDREYQTTPMRAYLRHVVESTPAGYTLDIASVSLSMFAVVLYICSTYQEEPPIAFEITDVVIASIFLVEFVFRFYIARSRRAFLFSWFSIIDILTIVPPYLELFLLTSNSTSLMFLRAVRVLKILRILQLSRLIKHSDNEVSRALVTMAFTVIVLIFCSACVFMEVEMDPDDPEVRLYNFHQSMYWSVVTCSTLGYGDISPNTFLGQWLVVAMMILMFSVIPYQTNKVLELIAQGNQYLRKRYHRRQGKMHVVIMGYMSGDGMQDVIDELYHEDHGFLENDIVFLSDQPPDRKMQNILLTHSKTHQLHFLEGQMKDARDLERAKVHKAQMVFIIANRDAVDAAEEDTQNIMTALAVDKFIQEYCRRPNLRNMPKMNRCLVQLLLPTSRPHLVSAIRAGDDGNRVPHAINIVCLNELSAQMIGLSANNCPGLSTLLLNLCRSATHYLPLGVHAVPWHFEYWWGVSMEIYQCPLSPYFQGMTFRKVAGILYSNLQVVLIGIETGVGAERPAPSSRNYSPSKRPAFMTRSIMDEMPLEEQLLLGPMDCVIQDTTKVSAYIIGNHARCALSVASYGLEKGGEIAEVGGADSPPGSSVKSQPHPFADVARDLSQLSRITTSEGEAAQATRILSSLENEFSFKNSYAVSAVGTMLTDQMRPPPRRNISPLDSRMEHGGLPKAEESPRNAEEGPAESGSVEIHAHMSPSKQSLSRFHPERWGDEGASLPTSDTPDPRPRRAHLDLGFHKLFQRHHNLEVSAVYSVTGISNKHMFAMVDFHDLDADNSLATLAMTPRATTPRFRPSSAPNGPPGVHRGFARKLSRRLSASSVSVLLNPSDVTPCFQHDGDDDGEGGGVDASLMLSSNSKRQALKEAYHTRDEPWSIHASTLRTVEFSGHFLIIGWSFPAVVLLVASLRRRYLSTVRPIVIMDGKRPLEHWESVSIYQAVYFMAGQSNDFDDLLRAHARKAFYVLLMPPNVEGPGWNSRQGPRKDTLVVLAHQHLKYLAPKVPVLTELTEGMNQTFLSNTSLCGSSLNYQLLAVSYASGTVFLPNMLDALCIQAFFNPCVLRILKLLLTSHLDIPEDGSSTPVISPDRLHQRGLQLPPIAPSPPQQLRDSPRAASSSGAEGSPHGSGLQAEQWLRSSSVIIQIPVPEHMVGTEYGKLVHHLLEVEDMITIGLYRSARNQVLCNEMPFVYTNPPADAIVNEGDRAFVISSRMQYDPFGEESEQLQHGQEAAPKARSKINQHQQHHNAAEELMGSALLRRHSAPLGHDTSARKHPAAAAYSDNQVEGNSVKGDEEASAVCDHLEMASQTEQLMAAFTRHQQRSQKALMSDIQGLFDRMHGDIKEVRHELHEVRQAQKHMRTFGSLG